MGISATPYRASTIPDSLKIRCGFRLHQRLCELHIEFVHTLPRWSDSVNTVGTQNFLHKFLCYFYTTCTIVRIIKTKTLYLVSIVRHCVIIPYHQQKNTYLVFGMRTKVLDTRRWRCYYFFESFIWQMRLSRKSSPGDGCRELPGGARQ